MDSILSTQNVGGFELEVPTWNFQPNLLLVRMPLSLMDKATQGLRVRGIEFSYCHRDLNDSS